MDINKVWSALDTEIEYQRRRWGYRQPDGSFTDETHTISEYIIYAQKYLADSFIAAASRAGDTPALDILREGVYLAIACLIEIGVSIDEIKATLPSGGGNLCDFLLDVEVALICARSTAKTLPPDKPVESIESVESVEPIDYSAIIYWLLQIVGLGLGCFQALGVNSRDLSDVINERDGLPA